MKDFTKMHIEVWSNEPSDPKNPPEDMLAIHAEMPKEQEGLHHLWFVMSRQELTTLMDGRTNVVKDGYHNATVYGDSWFFYDMDGVPREKFGNMKVPFYNAILPRTFMKTVLRLCKKTWALIAKGRKDAELAGTNKYDLPGRINIEISQKHRTRSSRLYGQGKGRVELDFGDWKPEETTVFWEQCLAEGGKTFSRCVEGILAIAANSTWGFHQVARLRISKDLDGFNWCAFTPKGQRIMNGGLVNHSREGGHDWSSHT